MDAPRWPRDAWISPSALNSYATCPHRVRLHYIDRIKPPWSYQVHLNKGRIAHTILRDIALLLRRDYPLIGEAEILRRARLPLPTDQFPSAQAREANARDIVRWVTYGAQYLARISRPEWLLIERNQTRTWSVLPGQSPLTIMARPDVVLKRMDDDGKPLIEIIDYKTGKIRPETIPPVMMRFVARQLLQEVTGDASAADVRFTYLWLDHAETTHIDLSVEYCNNVWGGLSRQLQALVTETDWPAKPSFLCNYCPYHKNICMEETPPGTYHDV